jgi:uncharacterized protein
MMLNNAADSPRTPVAADLRGMLALNAASEAALSPLDHAGLQHLMASSLYCGVVGDADPLGFVIVLDQDATYTSPNFLWFRKRLNRFAYIDRVVVDAKVRGIGHARRLYDAAFAAARARNHTVMCCEVNQTPPNPASDRFHERLGFSVVGTAVLPVVSGHPAKCVRYLEATI